MVKKNIPQFENFKPQEPVNVIKQVRTYQLITPLFGGGVNPGEVDMLTPIRGSEIRGHLRFWWRACRGGKYGNDLQGLKAEEDKIWGKAHKKDSSSKKDDEEQTKYDDLVYIQVEITKQGARYSPKGDLLADGNDSYKQPAPSKISIPRYAVFPLEQESKEQRKEPSSLTDGIEFMLYITYPSRYEEDIQAALWAWETFGGIGARTRRGFGAIRLTKVEGEPGISLPSDHTASGVKKWILENLERFIGTHSHFHEHIPHLSLNPQLKILGPFRTPERACEQAWKELISRLQRFRQPIVKDKLWLMSKQARAIVQGNKSNKPYPFPKAVLGLPVVFHLSDDNTPSLQHKTKGQERLASPIILRPFVLQKDLVFGVALLLQGNHVHSDNLVLMPNEGNQSPFDAAITVNLTDKDAQTISVLNGQTDVLQAFMNSLDRSDDSRPNNYSRQRDNNRSYDNKRTQNREGDKRWNRD